LNLWNPNFLKTTFYECIIDKLKKLKKYEKYAKYEKYEKRKTMKRGE